MFALKTEILFPCREFKEKKERRVARVKKDFQV
jgi:hypothetical protein